jgi:predicted acetyltransferase
VQGRTLQSAFIAGAATAKARRGQGLMRALLLETLRLLKSRGTVMTHLYPFKHSFYEKFGWTTYSYVFNKSVKMRRGNTGDVAETRDRLLLATLYSAMMSRFDGYVVRNRREWEWRLDEHTAGGGKAAVLKKNGTPAAYMLYNSNERKAEVVETVYNSEEDIYPLLNNILEKGYRSAAYSIPAAGPRGAVPYGTEPLSAVPYGMARVVDAQALLKLFGAEEALNYMRISDGFAGWNNIGEGAETDIGPLAKIVHRGAKNILSKDECSICNGLLKKVFSPRVTCIFEQY